MENWKMDIENRIEIEKKRIEKWKFRLKIWELRTEN